MSRFHGKQGRGAMAKVRMQKDWQARLRNEQTDVRRTAWWRRAMEQNRNLLESGSLEGGF